MENISLGNSVSLLLGHTDGTHDAVLSLTQASLACSSPLKEEEGTSVGLLLTSYDRTLVVKEISSEEVEEMHNILSEYHQVRCTQAVLSLFLPLFFLDFICERF